MLEITKNVLGGAAALSILVVACTTTTTDNSSSSSGGSSSGSSSGGKDAGSSGSSGEKPDEKDSGGGGGECAEEKTALDCADCCGGLESLVPYNQVYISCACETPCKEQCATTICAATPQDPDAACEACLDADTTIDACDPPAQAACDKDKACNEFTVCTLAAKCLEKPRE